MTAVFGRILNFMKSNTSHSPTRMQHAKTLVFIANINENPKTEEWKTNGIPKIGCPFVIGFYGSILMVV